MKSIRATLMVCLLAMGLLGFLAAPAVAAGEQVKGRLIDEQGAPVPGVEISVEQAGNRIGASVSDSDGRWVVDLPRPGRYTVVLNEDTLPDGGELRENSAAQREVDIDDGTSRNILFPLGAVVDSGPTLTERLAQGTVDGLQLGALIAITAIGLSLIFGTTGLINFAHGELVTLGAVVAYLLNAAPGGPGLHIVLAGLLAIPAIAALGGGLDSVLWRPLRRRGVGLVPMFIATIGLSLILRQVILIVFGGDPHPYAQYALQDAWVLGPVSITPRDLVVFPLSLGVLVAVGVLLTRTRLGTAIRAVADNRDLAGCSGIDVDRVVRLVWVIGGGLAALGGVLYGIDQSVTWNMGLNLLLLMFAGVILGGLGTAFGAVVGSLLIGLLAQLSTVVFDSELQTVWALALLILALLVRPQGLLGRRERVG